MDVGAGEFTGEFTGEEEVRRLLTAAPLFCV